MREGREESEGREGRWKRVRIRGRRVRMKGRGRRVRMRGRRVRMKGRERRVRMKGEGEESEDDGRGGRGVE